MSAVKLIPASGGGSVSLVPPNSTSGSDITFTLPSTSQSFGKILQVVQTVKSDTTSSSSDSFVDIAGLSADITPTSSSNKVLLMYSVYVSFSNALVAYINPVRGSTTLAQTSGSPTNKGTGILYTWGSGNSMLQMHYTFLDSPNTTSATTYKLQYRCHGSGTVYINRYAVSDDYYGTSTLTLMEVAA